MKTNELKKNTKVQLRNGWKATLLDNKKGNVRDALVEGFCTEAGSIYTHNIVARFENGSWIHDIEYTDSQKNCEKLSKSLFG